MLSGTPISHNNLNKQHFKPLLKKAELSGISLYDLRHTFATLWMESGESAEVLQKILRHSKAALTMDTYSHLSPGYQKESFGRFGEDFGRRKNGSERPDSGRDRGGGLDRAAGSEKGRRVVPANPPLLRVSRPGLEPGT